MVGMESIAVMIVHVRVHVTIDCNMGMIVSVGTGMHMVGHSFDRMAMVMSRPMGVRDRSVMRVAGLARVAAQKQVKAQTCNRSPGDHTQPWVELFRHYVA